MTGHDVAGQRAQPSTAELLVRIEELTRRVEWLEASLANGVHVPTDVPPDVVLAISAAVAAFLGKRATVRQVHLSGSTTWAQQGRATVMSSHSIEHAARPSGTRSPGTRSPGTRSPGTRSPGTR